MASNISVPTGDPSDIIGITDKLGGAAIDRKILNAINSGLPELAEQTGGYEPQFAHLAHLPLFPLYSDNMQAALQAKLELKNRKVHRYRPPPELHGKDKIAMKMLEHTTGAHIMQTKKAEARLQCMGIVSSNYVMQQNRNIVFTRWGVPDACASGSKNTWFVDVLEWRMKDGSAWKANVVEVKSNKDVSLKLIEKVVKLKEQKGWSKSWNSKRCEEMAWVQEGGTEVPMVIVARIQRRISGPESHAALKDFMNSWFVPMVTA
jgi:hypothetical protein